MRRRRPLGRSDAKSVPFSSRASPTSSVAPGTRRWTRTRPVERWSNRMRAWSGKKIDPSRATARSYGSSNVTRAAAATPSRASAGRSPGTAVRQRDARRGDESDGEKRQPHARRYTAERQAVTRVAGCARARGPRRATRRPRCGRSPSRAARRGRSPRDTRRCGPRPRAGAVEDRVLVVLDPDPRRTGDVDELGARVVRQQLVEEDRAAGPLRERRAAPASSSP